MAARIGRVALAAMTAFACLVAGCMARKPDMPNVAWNENAAAAIGPDIAEVARNAGVDVPELVHLLNDHDIGYDKVNKRLLYACEGMAVPAGATPAAAPGSAIAGAPDPTDLSLAFKLHSRPGAPRRLVLDFTGHTTTGTAWNSASRPSIVTPPYDLDGVPSTFSDTERRNIIAIWRAVAEDFAAFDVDVTTEETDASGAQLNLADNGARAVIGGSSYDWFGSGAGGVAYVNTFGNTYYDPAFVFPAQLGSGYPKYVWEATSHELGHRLGLSHDGDTLGNAYYGGSGIWAPIMGVGYNKPVTQFSKGEYPNANNLQDDLAIMTNPTTLMTSARGFLAYRSDDLGSTMAAAAPLAGNPTTADPARTTAAAVGNIERTGDSDWLSFAAGAGSATVTIAITPASPNGDARANVDLRLEVWAAGAAVPLATFNTAGALLSGANTVTLPAAGTYYVAVTGTGDTDFTSYASLGEYSVALVYPTPSSQPSPSPTSSPSSSPSQSPSPSPAPIREIRLTLSSYSIIVGKGTGKNPPTTYGVSAILIAKDENGAPITGTSVTMSATWASASYSKSSTKTVAYTTSAAGTFQVFASPTTSITPGSATLRINTVSASPFTWNQAASTTVMTFSWP